MTRMINSFTGSLIRKTLRELQVKKCNLHVNNFQVRSSQLSLVLPSVNSVFQNQKTKCYPTLKSGIYSRNVLFKNLSSYSPSTFSVRYQSTTSTIVDPAIGTQTAKIIEQVDVDKPWFVTTAEDTQVALKDISESILGNSFEQLLNYIHATTGLPWWGTIVLTTLIVRSVIILPFAVHQRGVLVKLENAQRDMEEVVEYIKQEIRIAVKTFGWPVEFARTKYQQRLQEEWKDIFSKERTHPIKACSLIVIQTTSWMGMSIAIANMCCAFPHSDPAKVPLYSEMVTGGFQWFTNLAATDSSLLLPVSIGLMNLAIVGIHSLRFKDKNIVQKITLGVLSAVSLGMIPLAMNLPAGLLLYWASSSAFGLIFNTLLLSKAIRGTVGIPEVKPDSQRKQEVFEWMSSRQNADVINKLMAANENPIEKIKRIE